MQKIYDLLDGAAKRYPVKVLDDDIRKRGSTLRNELNGQPRHKLGFHTALQIMAMNDVPSMSDRSYGFARRLIVMGYRRRFEEHEMDPELDRKLAAERDGIFNWAVFGLERLLRQNGFTRLDITDADREDFLHSLNPFLIFVEENCEFGPGRYVPCQDFYRAYKTWCVEAGHRNLSRNKFYEQVLQNFPQVKKGKVADGTARVFRGIGLESSEQ